jgi:glucosamine--fructose-6-phosphate aminotransferase (isomerizing)
LEAVENALTLIDGSWALAVLGRTTGSLVVTANRSPMLVARSGHGEFAASDIGAIAEWTNEFRVLEDGDVVELGGTRRWRNRGVEVSPRPLTFCSAHDRDVALNGHTDYMAKEIDEQPEAAARLLDELGDRIANGKLWSAIDLPPFDRLRIVGCGTSLNAGRVIARVVSTLGRIPVRCSVGSEAADEVPEDRTLCLAISQSGETADVLHAVQTPCAVESPLLVLTNQAHSTLGRRADAVVTCATGPEIGVAATKTFVCQVIAGTAVMISALVAMDRLSPAYATRLVHELRQLPGGLAAATTTAKCVVPQIAEGLTTASGFIFIARGSGLPYAAEGALKLKELTYRWAEYCPAGELKHGPLALIGSDTPVVVIDNADPKLGANVAEVRARGGCIISMGSAGTTVPVVSRSHAPWGPLETAVPLQILARSVALFLGRDVDKPRNLAKSVTVE